MLWAPPFTKSPHVDHVTSSKFLCERLHAQARTNLITYLLLFGVLALLIGMAKSDWLGTSAVVTQFFLPAAFIALIFVVSRSPVEVMRCYERGVCYSVLGFRRAYRYDEIAAMKYEFQRDDLKTFRHKYQRVLEIDAAGDGRTESLTFNDNVRVTEKELLLVRNAIARGMAPTLLERIIAGQRLSWAGVFCFEGDRLIFDFKSTPERSIHVSEIDFIDFDDETASVYIVGRETPFAELGTNERNFFPGLFCLELLRQRVNAQPVFIVDHDGTFHAA